MNGLTVCYVKILSSYLIRILIHYAKTRCILGYKHTLCKRTQRMLGPNFPFIRSHEQGNRLVSNIITSLLKTRKHYVQMENNREISSM